jgi:hypothetical protein
MRKIPVLKRRRTSSVLKHGAYAMGLLQGEDPAAFKKLHKRLVSDLSPIGVLEEEVVWDMARILWRKRHMDGFGAAAHAWDCYYRIEKRQRAMMAERLQRYTDPNVFSPEKEKELREKIEKAAREELGDDYKFIEAGREATLHSIMKRFDLVARLDAMLDGYVKRLLHLRGLRSVTS